MKTLAELETAPAVAPEELVATLAHYAEEQAVTASVVIVLADRAPLEERHLKDLVSSAVKGESSQRCRGFAHHAEQYRRVAAYLRLKLLTHRYVVA